MVGKDNWPSDWNRRPDPPSPSRQRDPSPPSLRVFISYSHLDAEDAGKIGERLRAAGHRVIIDSHSLLAGKSIKEFIEESIKAADAVISIISKYSLVSAWVATESGEALIRQQKRVIGCFIDDTFLKPSFVDEAMAYAETEKNEIGKQIQGRIQKGRRFRDLYENFERIADLQANIDEIVGRLRARACIDLRPLEFEAGIQRLLRDLVQK